MSTPRRLPLQDRSNLQTNLQIRVVPYSPPRISSDYSATSQLDRNTCSPLSEVSPSNVDNVEVHQADTPLTTRQYLESNSGVSSPVSPLGQYERTASNDAGRSGVSTPRRPSTSSSNRRLKHVINVHADKTFSLTAQVEYESSSIYSSSLLNSTVTNSTYGRNSSVTFSYGRRSSTLPAQQEDSAPTSPEEHKTPPKISQTNAASSSSPWNYEFVGGVRKVYQQSPQSEFSREFSPIASPATAHRQSPTATRYGQQSSLMLIPRKPLPGCYTANPGDTGTPNFTILKRQVPRRTVHGRPSMESDKFSFSSKQNYRVVADSCSSDYSLGTQSRPRTEDSEPNFVKHEELPSPSVANTPETRLKSEFSRESLIVPPLNTARKLFTDKPVSVKLPQGGSSPRFLAAWSAMMNQDAARALFGSRIYPPRNRNTRASSQAESSASTPRTHQFQSQAPLSTVFSESEGASERLSRSFSPFAGDAADDGNEPGEYSFTREVTPTSDPVDWPQAAYGKGKERDTNQNFHLVGAQDEHGDGLTDLRDLVHHRPSRRGGYPAIMSSYAADRNLWSSGSARATNWAIPAWAR